jgi:hypothetical protein
MKTRYLALAALVATGGAVSPLPASGCRTMQRTF